MTLDEIRRGYAELAEILTRSGLRWVVDQVEQTVHSGRAVEKPTKIFTDEEREEESPLFGSEQYAPRRSGKPTAMMSLEPWSEADQIVFLIDGVRQAIALATSAGFVIALPVSVF